MPAFLPNVIQFDLTLNKKKFNKLIIFFFSIDLTKKVNHIVWATEQLYFSCSRRKTFDYSVDFVRLM